MPDQLAPSTTQGGINSFGFLMMCYCQTYDEYEVRLVNLAQKLTLCSWEYSSHPADTRCKNNVMVMSKRRRFDVIMTLLLRQVSVEQDDIKHQCKCAS